MAVAAPTKGLSKSVLAQVGMAPKWSQEQQMAIELCLELDEPIASVTGGAGTGKTAVLGEVYNQLVSVHGYHPSEIALAAPTGRAAKRIQELTGIEATTIHRLLEFPQPWDDDVDENTIFNEPRRTKFNPLDKRFVIVDEASMLGPTLYRQLVDALPKRACVRFFGDNNQLAPVEQGIAPFIDILHRRPAVELTFNFRSGDEIVSNALRILRGSIPQRNSRFEIVYATDPVRMLNELMTDQHHFAGWQNQILCPANKGRVGCKMLNPSMQMKFNRKGPFLQLKRFDEKEAPLAVRAGDKFIWIKNDYRLGIMNGETGTIGWIDTEAGSLQIQTPDQEVIIPPTIREFNPFTRTWITKDPRKEVELGYVITVHKAQGSEFQNVVIVMAGSNGAMLVNRRLFYTAITRAKDRVTIITDRRAMGMAMKKTM
jgi:exodeoxyribonuclease V alpha subunit